MGLFVRRAEEKNGEAIPDRVQLVPVPIALHETGSSDEQTLDEGIPMGKLSKLLFDQGTVISRSKLWEQFETALNETEMDGTECVFFKPYNPPPHHSIFIHFLLLDQLEIFPHFPFKFWPVRMGWGFSGVRKPRFYPIISVSRPLHN